jgi:hypothetical protein
MIMACIAALAVVPAAASARHRSHHRHHRHAVRHAQVRHERFGSDSTAAGSPRSGDAMNAGDAGTVQSFTGGVLTIALTGGGTVSGTVTPNTELKCETPEPAEMQTEVSSSSRDGGGDNSGPGDSSGSGDDNGRDDNNDNEVENEGTCGAITAGMVVRHAELTVSGAGAVWNEVELACTAAGA